MASSQTFDDRDGWIWFDGTMVPWRDANIHVLTHGLHYASSVFEGELQRQPLAVLRCIELPTAPIERSRLNFDEVLVDELSQHAVEALLCDPQYLQKLGDREPRPSADKIEDPMMGAPESVSLEQSIGVSDEIAVSEKELFDEVIHWLFAAARLRRGTRFGDVGRHRRAYLGQQC